MDDSASKKIQLIIPPQPKSLSETIYKAFIEAILILYQQGYFISGLKLMLCSIDTMSFLDTGKGNTGKEFKAWLNKYVDLKVVGIDSNELWEHRSALMHMTRFHSKTVDKGAVKFLIPSFGTPPQEYAEIVEMKMKEHYGTNYKTYSIEKLFEAVFEGVDRFLAEVNANADLKSRVLANLGEVVPDIPIVATKRPQKAV